MFSWYKYLIVNLVFSHLGFWSGNLFLFAPFPDLCLLVLFIVWTVMFGTLGTKPPKPHYYHLFILFIKLYLSNFIHQILFIYLCIYLFIYSWCFDDLSDRALQFRGRNLSFGMSLA